MSVAIIITSVQEVPSLATNGMCHLVRTDHNPGSWWYCGHGKSVIAFFPAFVAIKD